MDYLDANILWDFLNEGKFASYIANGLERGELSTSFFVLTELQMALGRHFRKEVVVEKTGQILELKNLKVIGMNEDEFRVALRFVSTTKLHMFDAIHAALCISNGYTLATYDKDFRGMKGLKTFEPQPGSHTAAISLNSRISLVF